MNVQKVYENLTGVDLQEQKKIGDERGKGYYGEYLVFQELYDNGFGVGKLLMNVEIPGLHTDDTEIDLIYLHETGIYVFEVKHYKGDIYGKIDDDHWTQFFKTVKNNVFYNPVKQNQGHIDALKKLIKKDAPINSIIVFTNPEVSLHITGSKQDVTVCRLREMSAILNSLVRSREPIYNLEQLEKQYEFLLPYSKVMNASVPLEGGAMSVSVFLDKISTEGNRLSEIYKQRNDEMEAAYKQKNDTLEAQYKARKRKYLIICLIAIAAITIAAAGIAGISIASANSARSLAEAKYQDMLKNFTHATSVSESGYDISDDVIKVSDVAITPSADLNNAVILNGKITIKSRNYGFLFKGSKIIVQLTNGTVKEYDLPTHYEGLGFQEYLTYYNQSVSLSTPDQRLTLVGLSENDIDYIKLRGVKLCQYPSGAILRDDIELELYKK